MLQDSKIETQQVGHTPPSIGGVSVNETSLEEATAPAATAVAASRVAILCPTHNLPYTQIEVQTMRPVCEECIAKLSSIDIECERVKATNRFRQ